MPSSVKAFSPGHISGYFSRIQGRIHEETGSIGAGLVLKEGVVARVRRSEAMVVTIIADGVQTSGSPPIEEACERIGVTADIQTVSRLPIRSGFGLSAASLLATLTAADTLFSLSMTRDEIASLAHEIEVTHRHGLGDAAAEGGGGLVCRTRPGIAGVTSRMLGIPDPISIISIGEISTGEVLGSEERMAEIAAAYPGRCPRDLSDFMSLSRSFAEASGLITGRLRTILRACDQAEIPASMTMLGEGVFAVGEGADAILSGFGRTVTTQISSSGPGIIEVIR